MLSKPNTYHLFVALVDLHNLPHIAGYVAHCLKNDTAHVISIAVGSKFRGHGVAKQMMLTVMNLAKKLHAKLMTLRKYNLQLDKCRCEC